MQTNTRNRGFASMDPQKQKDIARKGGKVFAIGPEIDPGVPWTISLGEPPLALALKSGNFGAPDFFLRAFSVLSEGGNK